MVRFVPVVYKRSRVSHQHKFSSGVLHTGKQFYVRRVDGNVNHLKAMGEIARDLEAKVGNN